MKNFRTGNVVKLHDGHCIILVNVTNDDVYWISFSFSNSSGITKMKTEIKKEKCFCGYYHNNEHIYDEDCDKCYGKGYYDNEISGMDKAEYLADNVKEYILKRLLKNFDF